MTTMLKAAKLVDPTAPWVIGSDGKPCIQSESRYEYGAIVYIIRRFDPEKNAEHQMALQIALEKLGWKFGYLDEQFRASFDDGKSWANVAMDTKSELLIECVEAMEAL
jgi:hypothetical protein